MIYQLKILFRHFFFYISKNDMIELIVLQLTIKFDSRLRSHPIHDSNLDFITIIGLKLFKCIYSFRLKM